jgi:hypothetical protein
VRDTRGYRQWLRVTTNRRVQTLRTLVVSLLPGVEAGDSSVERDPVHVRLLRRAAMLLPPAARGSLKNGVRRLLWAVAPYKPVVARLAGRGVQGAQRLVGALRVVVVRTWMRVELVSDFAESGHTDDIFRLAAAGRTAPPPR